MSLTTDSQGERVFFCTQNGAHKFWRVSVCNTDQTVNWGRIGTTGQTLTRTFDSFAAAQEATSGLIAQKIAKGYEERSAEAASIALPVPVVRTGKAPDLQLLLFDDAASSVGVVRPVAAPASPDVKISLF